MMKLLEAEIRKWAQLYSDELMHFSDEDFEHVVTLCKGCEFDVLPDNKPVVCIYIKDLGQDVKKNEND